MFELVVGCVDKIRLSRCTNVRAKENPHVRPLHKVSSAFEIRINA